MKRFEIDLPIDPGRIYEGVELIARPSGFYIPQETANKLAEFLQCLYHQLPYDVAELLSEDPRIENFRKCLTSRL